MKITKVKTVPVKFSLQKINFRCQKSKTIIRMSLGPSKETEKELELHLVMIQEYVSGWINLKPTKKFPYSKIILR